MMTSKTRSALFTVVALVLAAWPGCGEYVDLPTNAIVTSAHRNGLGELYLRLAGSESLEDHMRLFDLKGLYPGIDLAQSIAAIGQPSGKGRSRGGQDEYWSFQFELGEFQVVKQEVQSEGDPVVRWFLRWLPVETDPLSVLRPSLVDYLGYLEGTGSMQVMETRPPMRVINIKITEGRISEIWILG